MELLNFQIVEGAFLQTGSHKVDLHNWMNFYRYNYDEGNKQFSLYLHGKTLSYEKEIAVFIKHKVEFLFDFVSFVNILTEDQDNPENQGLALICFLDQIPYGMDILSDPRIPESNYHKYLNIEFHTGFSMAISSEIAEVIYSFSDTHT